MENLASRKKRLADLSELTKFKLMVQEDRVNKRSYLGWRTRFMWYSGAELSNAKILVQSLVQMGWLKRAINTKTLYEYF